MTQHAHAPHNHPAFVAGRDRIARLVTQLLSRNDLSHLDLEDFARWAGAGDWLSKSQISTLRNSKLPKPGPQLFLALAMVNRALAELTQPVAKRPARAPLPAHLRHLAVEPGPWFLVSPETGQPCHEGDMFRIYCSSLDCPELEGSGLATITPQQCRVACERLQLLAQGWINQQGLLWKQGREPLLLLYPEKAQARRERIWQVIRGDYDLDPEEFTEEVDALRFLVGRLQGGEALSVRAWDRWLAGGSD